MNDIQMRIKKRRLELKLTQKDVAIALGVTQQTYQEIESGKTKDMRVSTLKDICAILQVSSDWLLGIGETRENDFVAPSVKRAAKKEYLKQTISKK